MAAYQNQHLGALHVGDKWHRVVYRQAPRAVPVRHEGRHPTGAAIAHGQVDDQVKLLLCQEVRQVVQLPAGGVDVFERPLHGLHLHTA